MASKGDTDDIPEQQFVDAPARDIAQADAQPQLEYSVIRLPDQGMIRELSFFPDFLTGSPPAFCRASLDMSPKRFYTQVRAK